MAPESLTSKQVKLAEARADAIAKLTEFELLGLDKPTRDQLLTNKDEGEEVPKVVYLLHQAGKNEVMMNAILSRFNLNDGVYDEKENPGGIFIADTKDTNRLKILLVARLIGANSYVTTTFFAGNNNTKGLSLAALAAVQEAHLKRERYPLDHLQEVPKSRVLFEKIKSYGGPDPEEVFHPDATIPPAGDWIMRKGAQAVVTFDVCLKIVADALSGQKTEAELAREHKMPPSTINSIISRVKKGKSQVLSDEVLDLIKAKIKK